MAPRIDKLPDGTLVVSYGLRNEAKITAIPSFDGGKTWPADRRVTILHIPSYGAGRRLHIHSDGAVPGE